MKTLLLLLTLLLTSCGSSGGGSSDDSTPTADRLAGTYELVGYEIGIEIGNGLYQVFTQDDAQSWSGVMGLFDDHLYSAGFRIDNRSWDAEGKWAAQGDQLFFYLDGGDIEQGTYTADGDLLMIEYEYPDGYRIEDWENRFRYSDKETTP